MEPDLSPESSRVTAKRSLRVKIVVAQQAYITTRAGEVRRKRIDRLS